MQHFAKKNIFAKENFGEKVFKKFKKKWREASFKKFKKQRKELKKSNQLNFYSHSENI